MTNLNQRIQEFYDRSTSLWLDTWGEHMHHGYYDKDQAFNGTHQDAQIRLVKELLQWGAIENANHILDAGCGIGGSARLLARLFDAKVLGCTLSPVQANFGQLYTQEAGLQDLVNIEARDMMRITRQDGPFDLIWSMESAEHVRNKQELLNLFHKCLSQDGKLLMATWFHRPIPPALGNQEQQLLNRIYKYYHLPPMVSISELEQMAIASGFKNVRTADWSEQVAPFWKAVIRSSLKWQSFKGLLSAGWPVIKGAWAMRYMTRGYQRGLINFGVLQGQKA